MNVERRSTDLPPDSAAPPSLRQLVTFTVADAHYCVDIMAVREIRAWRGATRLPRAPDDILGVINLRGAIVPVIDLKFRFGHGPSAPAPGHVVVIIASGGGQIGLLADGVTGIIAVEPGKIVPVPGAGGPDPAPMFEGLIAIEGALTALIALEHLTQRRSGFVTAPPAQHEAALPC